jgi:flagellin-like protein
MSTKNMLKSKKAISPILATLLLIVIAVAAIVVTYAWVMTYMSSTTTQAGILLKEENINWPSGKIVITLRNTGTADATIDKVYVGLSGNLTVQTGVTYSLTPPVVAKNGGTVTVTVAYPWVSKTTYYFRIAPIVGPPIEFQETAP